MKKELPKVFENVIKKKITNNSKIYMSDNKTANKKITEDETKKEDIKTIKQKLKKIMNTKNYISKIPVRIITNNKEIKTYIVGKNANEIITINNEKIEIKKIIDIKIDE